MKKWYLVLSKPRQDERAEVQLSNQGFEVFRPLIKVFRWSGGKRRTTVESMFPRYLFLCLDDVGQDWAPIRSTRGVQDLVRWGGVVPSVPEAVVERLQARMATNGWIDFTARDDFRLNERLRITDGPFAGYEALFQARNGEERVVVLLNIMRQEQRLSLPAQAVARA
ncbi:transcription/translation regulatory transformer protein RfaH [Alkalilimnicola ehrlichii]|uniref:Transcription/translation regulatory transformer protein RfaH n=1 Tax=Alkalilimnicola ehrlichii TaxID=351052 RepID=A0A3E0WMU9_9GAMM|nr:transcription/translation regulatory transformer protein RfaH [Alkalilimnicola ehrlichii]RFA26408.1 transcription/translation regulatory transformer protein RfaH [Alkalilimnicola ehrlichii]RFA33471.1 transcription/translation regulatory transformer protein RfaH [Alkalilimnicola ehrlichii]